MTMHQLTVTEASQGLRLDKFISIQLPELSRSRVQALIEDGQISLQDKKVGDASIRVKTGQCWHVRIPEIVPLEIAAQDIPLDIVFEDEHLLIINKPPGLTVHPAPGHEDNTLVNALLAHCGDSLSGIGGVARPGIVHRLDKDTSGLLVVAKNDAAHASLSAQLATRTLKRHYAALVWGRPAPAHSTITGNIGRSTTNRKKMAVLATGGKHAVTHYRTEESFALKPTDLPFASLLHCELETGRTHQIRVHLASKGHSLLGDPVYGHLSRRDSSLLKGDAGQKILQKIKSFPRQALHAMQLQLEHPSSQNHMEFICPLPQDMEALLNTLRELK